MRYAYLTVHLLWYENNSLGDTGPMGPRGLCERIAQQSWNVVSYSKRVTVDSSPAHADILYVNTDTCMWEGQLQTCQWLKVFGFLSLVVS